MGKVLTWAKQTVIVQKTHAKDRDEARSIAKGFSDRMYTSRETSTSYRFRQKPPSAFVPGSFRVKSIPKKGVTIVYGELHEKKADFTPPGGYFNMNFKTDDTQDLNSFIPPGSSWAPSGVTATNIKRVQDTAPTMRDTTEMGGLVPPIRYTSKYSEDKYAAKEHGMVEHKGKTIPKEVKSLADRIRKKEPGKSDEYAYRTAWDIFRSYTEEGKTYPHKSSESGLKREGGGTGPIHEKKGFVMNRDFICGFEKRAYDYNYEAKQLEKGYDETYKSGPGNPGRAAAVVGTTGGLIGAISGGATHGLKGALVGGLVGGGAGAGLGLLAAKKTTSDYEQAKDVMNLSPKERKERLQAEARGNELDRVRFSAGLTYNVNNK